jgi:hypothetical protein
MATVTIKEDSLQAQYFLEYVRTLPFAEVQAEKSKWQQVIDEGAVTVDEFAGELKRQLKEHYNNA